MALNPPSQDTYTVGEKLTAALMNKNVRDAVSFLANPPLFVGVQNTAQTIPNNTNTPLSLDTTTVDSYSGHSNTVNNSRYVAQVAGWYMVTGKVNFGASATSGQRATFVAVNGVAQLPSQAAAGVATPYFSPFGGEPVFLNVADYVEIWVFQSTGAAITLAASYSMMSAQWIHV